MSGLYRHIACGVDGSEASQKALAHAVQLRDQLGVERLSILHLIPPTVYFGVYYSPQTTTPPETPDWLSALGAQTPSADIVLIDSFSAYPPAEAVRWAQAEHVDLLVAASHRGIFHRMTVGSFAGYIAYHATCPVMLVPSPTQA
jgi:nucleotide-binding universal stress UspA family protein